MTSYKPPAEIIAQSERGPTISCLEGYDPSSLETGFCQTPPWASSNTRTSSLQSITEQMASLADTILPTSTIKIFLQTLHMLGPKPMEKAED